MEYLIEWLDELFDYTLLIFLIIYFSHYFLWNKEDKKIMRSQENIHILIKNARCLEL